MKMDPPETNGDENFDMTPMIDVVFLLIAFFMIVTTLIQNDTIELDLSKAGKGTVPDNTKGREFVAVDADGVAYLGATPMTEAADLIPYITEGNNTIKGYKVYLRADRNAPHKDVRAVMTAVAAGGVADIIFAVEQ
tara:strand:- start:54 stop:461 length:408 start_codon:yes stop_codon:yes gene_type:complete